MHNLSPAKLRELYAGDFAVYRDEDWAVGWHLNHFDQVRKVLDADRAKWLAPGFQTANPSRTHRTRTRVLTQVRDRETGASMAAGARLTRWWVR